MSDAAGHVLAVTISGAVEQFTHQRRCACSKPGSDFIALFFDGGDSIMTRTVPEINKYQYRHTHLHVDGCNRLPHATRGQMKREAEGGGGAESPEGGDMLLNDTTQNCFCRDATRQSRLIFWGMTWRVIALSSNTTLDQSSVPASHWND